MSANGKTLATIREINDYEMKDGVLVVWRYNKERKVRECVRIKLDPFTASGIACGLRRYLTRERNLLNELLKTAGGEA